jgi:hypothetical protein
MWSLYCVPSGYDVAHVDACVCVCVCVERPAILKQVSHSHVTRKFTEQVTVAVTPWICILEVLLSNIGRCTGYCERSSLCFPLFRCWDSTSSRPRQIPPKSLFQFIIHPLTLRRYILWRVWRHRGVFDVRSLFLTPTRRVSWYPRRVIKGSGWIIIR